MTYLHTLQKLQRILEYEVRIPLLIKWYGIKVDIYRSNSLDPDSNVYNNVYGVDAGAHEARTGGQQDNLKIGTVNALIVGDGWVSSDYRSVGTFNEGWMYCVPSDVVNLVIKEGDSIRFSLDGPLGDGRRDTKVRRYKIEELQSLGSTIEIVKRFRLSSLGD